MMARKRRRPRDPFAGYSAAAPGPPPRRVRRAFNRAAEEQVQAYVRPRSGAIQGYTNELARQLEPLAGQVGGIYQQAQQTQAGIDTTLANRLQGAGEGAAGTVAAQLAAAGQSTHPANLIRAQALGAANAGLAVGSANQGMLTAQGASAQTYAAGLPGLARLGGLQAQRDLSAQGAAMIPGIAKQMSADELNKWIARTGLGEQRAERRQRGRFFRKEQAQEDRQFYAGLAADVAKAQSSSSSDKKDLRQDIRETMDDARRRATELRKRTKTVTDKFGDKSEKADPAKWGVAWRQIMAMLRSDLGGRITNRQRRKLARQVLISAGFTPPKNFDIGPRPDTIRGGD
jgi:hypothetical protein